MTLRALVEAGLERVLEERRAQRKAPIKPVTFRGRGLAPEYRGAAWVKVRDTAYEGGGS